MQRADEVLAWMVLSRAPALDIPILSTAFEFLGGVSGLIDSSHAARLAAGVPAGACEFLDSAAAAPNAAERAWLKDPTHHLVPFTDPRYPCALQALEPAPIALYVAGNAD